MKNKCECCVNEKICKYVDNMSEIKNTVAEINNVELDGPINIYVHCENFSDKSKNFLTR